MSIKFLAGIIISVMIFLIMLAATMLVVNMLKEDTPIQTCKASVVKAATISKVQLTDTLKQHSYADCPRKDLGIIEMPNEEPQKKVAKVLADEFKECWYKFGEGKLNPLPGDLQDQAVRCYVCSTFEVDKIVNAEKTDSALTNYFRTFDDKLNYLKTSFLYNGQIPIYRLMYSYKDTDDFSKLKESETFLEDPDPLYKPGQKYNVVNMFIVDKDGAWGGLLGFLGLYSQETQSKMAVVKEENIPKVCYSLEN